MYVNQTYKSIFEYWENLFYETIHIVQKLLTQMIQIPIKLKWFK